MIDALWAWINSRWPLMWKSTCTATHRALLDRLFVLENQVVAARAQGVAIPLEKSDT